MQIDKLIDPPATDEGDNSGNGACSKDRRSSVISVAMSPRNRRAKIVGVPSAIGNMPSHKFKVGEIVALKPAPSLNVPGGIYEVVKQLPSDGECEYRIKSAHEPHERVVRESELSKA
jgi:hypothetical protein